MSTVSRDRTQSGGLNMDGGAIYTDGGSIVGRDNRGPIAAQAYNESSGDKPQEKMVEMVKKQWEEDKDEMEKLRKENKTLNDRLTLIDTLFTTMAKPTIGVRDLSVHAYIIHSCNFFREKRRNKAFQTFLANEAHRAGNKDV